MSYNPYGLHRKIAAYDSIVVVGQGNTNGSVLANQSPITHPLYIPPDHPINYAIAEAIQRGLVKKMDVEVQHTQILWGLF